MKVLRLCMAAMALAAAILPASAADIPVETFYQPRPAVVLFRWTGVHVGLHVGGAFGSKDETPVPFGLLLSAAPNPCPVVPPPFGLCGGIAPSPATVSVSGWLAGGQIGADYQIENWVIGVEGQASWTNANGSTTCGGVGTPAAAAAIVAGELHGQARQPRHRGGSCRLCVRSPSRLRQRWCCVDQRQLPGQIHHCLPHQPALQRE